MKTFHQYITESESYSTALSRTKKLVDSFDYHGQNTESRMDWAKKAVRTAYEAIMFVYQPNSKTIRQADQEYAKASQYLKEIETYHQHRKNTSRNVLKKSGLSYSYPGMNPQDALRKWKKDNPYDNWDAVLSRKKPDSEKPDDPEFVTADESEIMRDIDELTVKIYWCVKNIVQMLE